MKIALRLLWRERRAGELVLLLLALVIAVGSLSSVGFLADRVKGALARESHQMLGGDLLLTSDHPWPGYLAKNLSDRRLKVARTTTFPSMLSVGESDSLRAQLADVKAVSAGYPLRGRLRIAADGGLDQETDRIPLPGEAWVDDRLAAMLSIKLGDRLALGQISLRVSAVLTLEPDRAVNFFGVAPRLMMHEDDLAKTGLIQVGSRVAYRVLVAGESDEVLAFRDAVTPLLGRGERLEDPANARPEMRNVLTRAERFLGLAAMLSVVLAAVAIALAVRRYLQRHLDGYAVLRCVGLTTRALVRMTLLQFVVIAAVGAAIGGVFGYAVHQALHGLLAELIATELPSPSWWPLLQGFAAAEVLVLAFALPPVLQLRKISVVRVLRRELGSPEIAALGSAALGGGAVLTLLFWVAGDLKLGAVVGGGILAALAFFGGLAWGVLRGLKVWAARPSTRWNPWRAAVLSLARRPVAAMVQVVALSIGFLALLLLLVTRVEILEAWRQTTPPDAPNRFVINIQPDQVSPVTDHLRQSGLDANLSPMVRGRLVRINERVVGADDYTDERAQRLIEREFNLSWRDDLPEGNRMLAGRSFTAADRGKSLVTVEKGLAETLKISLGDVLIFSIAGQEQRAEVIGLRKLNWDSMKVNFFVLFPSGVIDESPRSYITSFHLPVSQHEAANGLVKAFSNLTVVDISAILRQLEKVIAQVSLAVQMIAFFSMAAGAVVLYAAMLAAIDERRKEMAILRALGGRKTQLSTLLASEFAIIGGLAGLFAAAGATAVGQIVLRQAFEIQASPQWGLWPVAVIGGALMAWLAGHWAIQQLLSAPPMEALRDAE